MRLASPSSTRRDSSVFRSSPLKPKIAARRAALVEISMEVVTAERKGPLATLFSAGSAAMAMEEALERMPADDEATRASPARRLLDAFRASPSKIQTSSPVRPSSPRAPSVASPRLTPSPAMSQPTSPTNLANSPHSSRSASNMQDTRCEAPAFTFYEDAEGDVSHSLASSDPATRLEDDLDADIAAENDDKENVAPPRERREAKVSTTDGTVPPPETSPSLVPHIPISLSTMDLPGAIGDVAPASRSKRPYDANDGDRRPTKQARLDV